MPTVHFCSRVFLAQAIGRPLSNDDASSYQLLPLLTGSTSRRRSASGDESRFSANADESSTLGDPAVAIERIFSVGTNHNMDGRDTNKKQQPESPAAAVTPMDSSLEKKVVETAIMKTAGNTVKHKANEVEIFPPRAGRQNDEEDTPTKNTKSVEPPQPELPGKAAPDSESEGEDGSSSPESDDEGSGDGTSNRNHARMEELGFEHGVAVTASRGQSKTLSTNPKPKRKPAPPLVQPREKLSRNYRNDKVSYCELLGESSDANINSCQLGAAKCAPAAEENSKVSNQSESVAAAGGKKRGGKYKAFSDRVDDLKAYREKNGHINVKRSENSSLYQFCATAKYARKNPGKGGTIKLTESRIAVLNALGFDWTGQQYATKSFEKRLVDLRAYRERNGNTNVTMGEDSSLACFCSAMRYSRKHPGKQGTMKLTEDRTAALDRIGFEWTDQEEGTDNATEMAALYEHGEVTASIESVDAGETKTTIEEVEYAGVVETAIVEAAIEAAIEFVDEKSKPKATASDVLTSSNVLTVNRGLDPPSHPPKNSAVLLNHSQETLVVSKHEATAKDETMSFVSLSGKSDTLVDPPSLAVAQTTTNKSKDGEALKPEPSEHDKRLDTFAKNADGTNLLVGVEILGRGGDNGVRCKITGGACDNFGQGQITLKQAGGKKMTVVELGAAVDLFMRVNYDLKDHESPAEKLVRLEQLRTEPPNYSTFEETSIPSEIERAYKLRRARKFNFSNPSNVDAEWLREKEERQLKGVGEEFTLERKKEVFVATVDAIIKKMEKEMEKSCRNAE